MRGWGLLLALGLVLSSHVALAQKPVEGHERKAVAQAQTAAKAKPRVVRKATAQALRKATAQAPRKALRKAQAKAKPRAHAKRSARKSPNTRRPAAQAANTRAKARVQAPRRALQPAQVAAKEAGGLRLQSSSVLVIDRDRNTVLLARNPDEQTSIASITKLMTAMVTLDAGLPLEQTVTISDGDVDRLKGTHSRLAVGTRLSRRDILRLALMSSENRAAASLARTYPGGRQQFIAAMNAKADALGMRNTNFADSAGLNPRNVSTANDLAKMVRAASNYALIREFTTTTGQVVSIRNGRAQEEFNNTNRLVRYKDPDWKIELSKTGYTAEAGRCLVMQARTANRPLILVLLDSPGKLTPIGDANRVRRWLESQRIGRGLASN